MLQSNILSSMGTSEGYVITEDGVRLYYRKLGSALQTVLIPNGIYLCDDFERLAGGRTLIFYDVRNRGYSDTITDTSKTARGILHDVDDLDTVRRHFGVERADLIGHSYIGLMVALYAMKYREHANRVVQIGPMQPHAGTRYPADLSWTDGTLERVFAQIGQQQKENPSLDPVESCRRFWSLLKVIYVADPAHAEKIDWGRCDVPNELNFMKHWTEVIMPSIQKLQLTAEDFAKAKLPVLTIHGRKDRSAPYGGGREWAMSLPDARLLTVENAAHAPWIETPEEVFSAIETFLDGTWPAAAEKIQSLDRASIF
jgi:pimeloyl-ACP methyl ester carboxylesterase